MADQGWWRSRRPDRKVEEIRRLTGVSACAAVELARLGDLASLPAPPPMTWVSGSCAVAVLDGEFLDPASGNMYRAGDVAVMDGFGTLMSSGALVLVAAAADADRVRRFFSVTERNRTDIATSKFGCRFGGSMLPRHGIRASTP